MFKHMGDHIVAIHVLSQVQDSLVDFVQNRSNLLFFTVFEHSLDDSASKLMDTHLINSCLKGIYDKLYSVTWELFNDFLNNMITIGILYTLHDDGFEFVDQVLLLDGSKDF